MDSIKLPQLFNTEEKYNQMIRETDTIEKFETNNKSKKKKSK